MLTVAKTYVTSDGKFFPTLESAQAYELSLLLEQGYINTESPQELRLAYCAKLVVRSGEVLDILTTTPTSLLKARKSRGGKKPCATKTPAQAEPKMDED